MAKEPERRISQIKTVWRLVAQAHGGAPAEVNAAQQEILERYLPAIHRYLLACLGDPDAADELCQEFSLRFVRGDFRNANPQKGRFRDLLKAALYHLIIDHHKHKQRAMPQAAVVGPEPAAEPESTLESDRQFLIAWRADLLKKSWDALLQEERRTGRPLHSMLYFRAEYPDLRSPQMAEQLSERLGKPFTADQVRQWLHLAREKFAELLLAEVSASLREPSLDAVEEELIDLDLFEYCRAAVDRLRAR
jgi:RNA polymerase sigma-70 factor (ECF subfamily)